MVLKSSDGILLFEKNVPHDFTVQLNRLIHLDGYWMVALTEFQIQYTDTLRHLEDIYVYSNICDESFVGASEKPLLRKVHISKDSTEQQMKNKQKLLTMNVIFDTPYYVPLRLGQLNQVHIYIEDGNGIPSSFINEAACVTLHFKKYPFF